MQNGKRQSQQGKDDNQRPERGGSSAEELIGGYNAQMVEHVRMVTGLIEGRKVSRREVLKMLDRAKKRDNTA